MSASFLTLSRLNWPLSRESQAWNPGPAPPIGPQRALIKVKREMKGLCGGTVMGKGWGRDMVSLSVSN